jgi:hypothetical protein
MTTFAPHRDTLESFVDCIHGGADKDTLTRLLAEDVVLYGPFGDEPVTGREAAVETIKTVNRLSSDDTYMEVLSGGTHHLGTAHERGVTTKTVPGLPPAADHDRESGGGRCSADHRSPS